MEVTHFLFLIKKKFTLLYHRLPDISRIFQVKINIIVCFMLGSYEHVLFNLALLTLHRKRASVKSLLYAKRARLTYTAFKMHFRVSLYIFDKQIANTCTSLKLDVVSCAWHSISLLFFWFVFWKSNSGILPKVKFHLY